MQIRTGSVLAPGLAIKALGMFNLQLDSGTEDETIPSTLLLEVPEYVARVLWVER